LRILVAEDDPVVRRLLEAMLGSWGFTVLLVDDGLAALRLLEEADAPRLVILDWMMPGMDGIDVCRRVRAQASERYTYLILLTARDRKTDVVTGLDAGADDYLTKPFDRAELKVRLRAAQRILDLQSELIDARERLRVEANHDSLTGLLNRKAILEELDKELARASREKKEVSLLLADVDHFKRVNDTFGHLTGDAVLREVAHRLRGAMRVYDSAGRYGGEEFLLLLPGCRSSCSLVVADRFRSVVGARPCEGDGQSLPVTVSIGVASSPEGGLIERDTLIRAADQALYRAKERGRNRCEAAPWHYCGCVSRQRPWTRPERTLHGPRLRVSLEPVVRTPDRARRRAARRPQGVRSQRGRGCAASRATRSGV
jgi:diguanylate cyclase (GGDEF)-like protein